MEQGTSIIRGYVSALHCKETWSLSQCTEGLSLFQQIIQYVQLKSDEDFQALQSTLSASTFDPVTSTLTQEALRVFYLSVSPSLYDNIASSINTYVRPSPETTDMRVVFEKPFGRDLRSAMALSKRLGHHLQEQEIFRVSECCSIQCLTFDAVCLSCIYDRLITT